MQNVSKLESESGEAFVYDESTVAVADNYMDRWIVSFTQTLIKFVKQEMTAYRLYTVVPNLVKFVEQLTNWYVRMNRKRLKGDGGEKDCQQALQTLFGVLFAMTKVMAPFVPFLTEHMYQNLKNVIKTDSKKGETDSVHYLMLPEAKDELIDAKIEEAVSTMQTVIELGRVVRDRKTMPMKYPLSEVVVIHKDKAVLDNVEALQSYIMEELNVRKVTVSQDKVKYGVQLQAQPDFKALGARLKNDLKKVMAELKKLSDAQLEGFQKSGELKVCGHTLGGDDLKLSYSASQSQSSSYEAHSDNDILILLDVTPDQSMLDEGLAREVINRIQKLRKKAKLMPTDDITIYYEASGTLPRIINDQYDFIQQTIKQPMLSANTPGGADVIITEKAKIKEDSLDLTFVRGHTAVPTLSMPPPSKDCPASCPFINVLYTSQSMSGSTTQMGVVLLENPKGEFNLKPEDFIKQVQVLFELQGREVYFFDGNNQSVDVRGRSLSSYQGQWLVVSTSSQSPSATPPSGTGPCCRYLNVQYQKKAGTVLLENPSGRYAMSGPELQAMVSLVFSLNNKKSVCFENSKGQAVALNGGGDACLNLHGSKLNIKV